MNSPIFSPPRHVIFGSGAIGRALALTLLRRGETSIRLINRSGVTPPGIPADAVEIVAGDAADPGFSSAAARGARVVYQVLNPSYTRWAEEFPQLQASVLAAAQKAGARLVSMENVYLYGRSGGRPFTEDHPHEAGTRKGRLRGEMSRDLLAAHHAGRVEVAIGRASDYFGPGGGAQSNLGDRVFGPALAGKTASVLGDPDQPHTYTYIPDIAEGLATLGEHPAAAGRAWHLPNDPYPHSTRELVELAYAAAGSDRVRLRTTPWPLLRLLALGNANVRELLEMRYEFDEPFVVESTRIAAELGVTATPAAEAIRHTLDSYRSAAVRIARPTTA